MNSLVRTIRLPQLNRSSVVATSFVVLFAIGMFLIPEFISFQQSLERPHQRADLTSTELIASEQRDVPSTEIGQRESPLDSVLRLIESGYSQGVREVSTLGDRLAFQPLASASRERRGSGAQFSARDLTWKTIRSGQGKEVLQQARGKALQLASTLPPELRESRFAMLNFVNGIAFVQGPAEQQMTPEMALDYLAALDLAVTKALVREGAERYHYMRWAEVSMGPLLASSRQARLKKELRVPFNPQLRLDRARVFMPPGRNYEFREDAKAYVDVHFVVRGKDVAKALVYQEGRLVGETPVYPPDEKGYRTFSKLHLDARKPVTVRVYDTFGATFERTYLFYPRVKNFAWASENQGVFRLNFPLGRHDPAIDHYFRYSTPGRRESYASNVGFVAF